MDGVHPEGETGPLQGKTGKIRRQALAFSKNFSGFGAPTTAKMLGKVIIPCEKMHEVLRGEVITYRS